jgi:hypothetical protein
VVKLFGYFQTGCDPFRPFNSSVSTFKVMEENGKYSFGCIT